MTLFGDPTIWLPLAFAALMGPSILIYVILDGFDLGAGLLLPFADADETWLVLAVGLLPVAFPQAHGAILGTLYLPVTAMLIGLILRGLAFEFGGKATELRYD